MQRRLTVEQISRHLGFHSHLCCDDKIALSKEYMKQHRDGLVYGQYCEVISTPNLDHTVVASKLIEWITYLNSTLTMVSIVTLHHKIVIHYFTCPPG